MTLVEAYYHARKLEWASTTAGHGSDPLMVRAPAVSHTLWLGALGCLWAGAFAVKFGWLGA